MTSAVVNATAPVLPNTLVTGAPAWLNEITPVELLYVISPLALIFPLTAASNPDIAEEVICEPFTLIVAPLVKFKLPFTNTSF